MNILFTFLSNLKLSLQQYIYFTVALVVGGLVVALRVQGSKLHKAQVQVLQFHYGATMDQQDGKVEASRERYLKALEAYKGAR